MVAEFCYQRCYQVVSGLRFCVEPRRWLPPRHRDTILNLTKIRAILHVARTAWRSKRPPSAPERAGQLTVSASVTKTLFASLLSATSPKLSTIPITWYCTAATGVSVPKFTVKEQGPEAPAGMRG